MVLTVSFVLSPVNGLVCHRHQRKLVFANLTPASRRQNHTTSPSANPRPRLERSLRPPHPAPYVCDDRETPLCVGRDGATNEVICLGMKWKYFYEWDWTEIH
jgi:hypothetical protein